jgi:hypothetical protein
MTERIITKKRQRRSPMTAEELKKQKQDKALVEKNSYLALAKWHDSEAARYRTKADACEELELVSTPSRGDFAGL